MSLKSKNEQNYQLIDECKYQTENDTTIDYSSKTIRVRSLINFEIFPLCLATVVTIREINPFAAGKGIMKIADLQILFKGSRFSETEEIMKFIVDLLGKFELALTWDNEHLLIPSLLPSEALLPFSTTKVSG